MSKRFFRRILPNADRVARYRVMNRLGPWINDARLWYINRRAIALGLAGGVFFGLMFPTAQMPLAALFAILLRCNLPAAVAGTFVSNPLTFVPIYLVAYRIGAAILNVPADESWSAALNEDADSFGEQVHIWWSAVYAAGPPLAMGLLVLATMCAAMVYVLINLIWRTSARKRYRQRTVDRE